MYMRMRSASSGGAEASIWLKAAWDLSYLPSCSRRRAASYCVRAWARAASAGWVPARVLGFLAAFFIGCVPVDRENVAGEVRRVGAGSDVRPGRGRPLARTDFAADKVSQHANP